MSYPIALLKDDFTDNTQSPVWASSFVTGSATKAETGGQVVFTLPSSIAGSHSAFYTTPATYDLTGDSFYWDIGTMVSTSVAATAYMQMYADSLNVYQWIQLSGTLKAQKVVAGVASDLYSVAWSAATYKYLRISESGGTVTFSSSTNGTSWTSRGTTTIASAFAVTALYVQFGAACGNVASPGTLKLDDVNLILPAPSSTWRETTADWSITNRLRPVTLAATANAQGVIVTADTMDSSRVLGGTLHYFGGPIGSTSGGYLALTEYASLVLAQASPFQIPLDGRVDLPAMVDARYMRLYHRSTDASAHTLREFVPRRIVQAEDIEAESIRAINIAAGAVTADKIFVLTLAAITANIGGLNIDTTGYLWQGTGTAASPTTGLKIYNSGGIGKLSTYNAGVEQITIDTDGKLKAGAGAVQLDSLGLTLFAESSFIAPGARTKSTQRIANAVGSSPAIVWGYVDTTDAALVIETADSGSVLGRIRFMNRTPANSIRSELAIGASGVTISGVNAGLVVGSGIDVGGTFGAGIGEIRTSGTVSVPPSSGSALFALDTTNTGSTLAIANNSTGTPFGAANNFSGLLTITDTNVTGCTALFVVGGGLALVSQSNGTPFTTTSGTASKINVYFNSGVLTIENKNGSSITFRVMAFRTRTTA